MSPAGDVDSIKQGERPLEPHRKATHSRYRVADARRDVRVHERQTTKRDAAYSILHEWETSATSVGLFFGEDIFVAFGAIVLMVTFLKEAGIVVAPMAANFNMVPAALLELPDKNAVIKAQAPTGALLLVVNIVLLNVLMFR